MSFAELVGRLSPKTPQLTLGCGGIPTLTTQDIAGALADAEQRTSSDAVHVFLLRANPEMAAVSGIDTDQMIRWKIADEYRKQYGPVRHLESEIDCMVLMEAEPAAVERLTDKLAKMRAGLWPGGRNERYTPLIAAVLREWSGSTLCRVCNGRKTVTIEARVHDCEHCRQTGVEPVDKARRAESMGIPRQSFEKSWDGVYTWLLRELGAMAETVEREGMRALWVEDAA